MLLIAAGIGYFASAHYGLRAGDETFILAHARRVQLGELPYRDFHVLYLPTTFVLLGRILALLPPWLQSSSMGPWGRA